MKKQYARQSELAELKSLSAEIDWSKLGDVSFLGLLEATCRTTDADEEFLRLATVDKALDEINKQVRLVGRLRDIVHLAETRERKPENLTEAARSLKDDGAWVTKPTHAEWLN